MKRLVKDEIEYKLDPDSGREYYMAKFNGFTIYVRSLPDGNWGWNINTYGWIRYGGQEKTKNLAYRKALQLMHAKLTKNLENVREELRVVNQTLPKEV